MSNDKYFPPKHAIGQFHCPHCGVYAKQLWSHLHAIGDVYSKMGSYGYTYKSKILELTHTKGTCRKNGHFQYVSIVEVRLYGLVMQLFIPREYELNSQILIYRRKYKRTTWKLLRS